MAAVQCLRHHLVTSTSDTVSDAVMTSSSCGLHVQGRARTSTSGLWTCGALVGIVDVELGRSIPGIYL